jgi:hypothetical protein
VWERRIVRTALGIEKGRSATSSLGFPLCQLRSGPTFLLISYLTRLSSWPYYPPGPEYNSASTISIAPAPLSPASRHARLRSNEQQAPVLGTRITNSYGRVCSMLRPGGACIRSPAGGKGPEVLSLQTKRSGPSFFRSEKRGCLLRGAVLRSKEGLQKATSGGGGGSCCQAARKRTKRKGVPFGYAPLGLPPSVVPKGRTSDAPPQCPNE